MLVIGLCSKYFDRAISTTGTSHNTQYCNQSTFAKIYDDPQESAIFGNGNRNTQGRVTALLLSVAQSGIAGASAIATAQEWCKYELGENSVTMDQTDRNRNQDSPSSDESEPKIRRLVRAGHDAESPAL